MTRVVIVGDIYNADLSIGGGPIVPPGIWPSPGHPAHPIAPGGRPPGIWGGPPLYPDQGLPGVPPGFWGGVAPPYPDQGLPPSGVGVWPGPGYPAHPIAPGGPPPGYWGGVAPPYPDQGLPPVGTPVPPELMPPPAVPEEIASQYIVSVYNPKTTAWTTKSYPPPG